MKHINLGVTCVSRLLKHKVDCHEVTSVRGREVKH